MKWLVAMSAVLLASCAGMSKVGPGDVVVRDTLAVKLDAGWNRYEGPGMGKVDVWTNEGLPLDTLRFFVGIQEGEPLTEMRGTAEKQVPRFRSAMQPHDVVEMFEAVATNGGNTFRLDKLAPATFAGNTGFRFDYTLVVKQNELEMQGFGYGTVRNKRLHLVVFQAPKVHYFTKLAGRAEAVAGSARLLN